MALKDRIDADRRRVFMQLDHFADYHTWNGRRFRCVTDEEEALKRKNNNVNDISWDNDTRETMVYVPVEDWPDRYPVPNDHGFFDGVHMKIMQVQNDMGMLGIVLSTGFPKEIAYENG